MHLYWEAVTHLAWDLIRDEALAGGRFGEPEAREWEQLSLDEQVALVEFVIAVGKVLNG